MALFSVRRPPDNEHRVVILARRRSHPDDAQSRSRPNEGGIAVLILLLAASEQALETLRVADNPKDREFVAELERITERTKRELDSLRDL